MKMRPPPLIGIPSMLEQAIGCATSAAAAKAEAQLPVWPMNPFARGMRAGSATDKVHKVLEANPQRWFEHWELMARTGHSRGAVAWALRYLGERKLVRSIRSCRHPSYRRYRVGVVASNE